MSTFCDYNINPLVQAIGKEPAAFTKKDLTDFIVQNEVRIVNFRYVAADGRLKTLNFPVTNRQYLDTILSYGERVDGSSLFPYIAADSSDLYVIPRFSTAYVDPFQEIPTVGFLCSYFTKDGLPLESAPEFTLRKAHKAFQERTGYTFEAMGELEFYLVDTDDGRFPAEDQHGYHESTPFAKFESFRADAIRAIAEVGGQIKYGHCEVGNFTLDGKIYEQNEIEFLVNPVESAADQLMMAKWILRSLAYQYGIDVTFAPKITTGKAGSGLHFHT
ncbi:MAG: glutamine synthetase beta-grasp domain-containing protein, partial [Bacteroidales bacterium]|nr:glutamine synthetase beta-grasp domain-containing protein [Bacteroidales bacterium]